jgi:glycine hydroxymethyltransferase
MTEVGRLIAQVLNSPASPDVIKQTRKEVGALTEKFPLYSWKREVVPAAH